MEEVREGYTVKTYRDRVRVRVGNHEVTEDALWVLCDLVSSSKVRRVYRYDEDGAPFPHYYDVRYWARLDVLIDALIAAGLVAAAEAWTKRGADLVRNAVLSPTPLGVRVAKDVCRDVRGF